MGKKQHSKDRMFITRTEWATEWGGAKNRDVRVPFKQLPFYCCSLTFTPFEDPVCTEEGHTFEILNIVPYIQKFGKNPVSGSPLSLKDLIKLHFNKNADGEYQCPVLHKVFTEFTHIVAVKTTGNVFCYEAVKELNIKTKNWKELLTDEPFSRDDIITIQDPNKLDTKVLTDFDHVKGDLKLDDEELRKLQEDPTYNINMSDEVRRTMRELGTEKGKQVALLGGGGGKAQQERAAADADLDAARERAAKKEGGKSKPHMPPALSVVDEASASVHGRSALAAKAGTAEKTAARVAQHVQGELVPVNTKLVKSRFTTGAASRSFTSTSYDPVTANEFEYVKAERNPTKKGYVRLHCSHGDLNLELHCDITPRTCENFLTLCERGYYNGLVFHRSIRNFMIQGGDPTGTGKGGESIWGKPFKDELNSKLLHSGRGMLSMANSGPHTNGSQFFILYKSAKHLDYKHTVFGRVVGGMEVLANMEKVPTDDDDRPLEEIRLLRVSIFVNPYTELDEEEERERSKPVKTAEEIAEEEKVGAWFSNPGPGLSLVANGTGVGKYLKTRGVSKDIDTSAPSFHDSVPSKKRKVAAAGVDFKDFSGW
eukprot:TRINITY_DN24435_c0_g1_i1.p1 TRINITY_DN24435_c0_g1~~TRINITY_DN24435_c0_g1_i1.p1  ORF type:complete len:596 (+),score=117.61 TRINITY_DN24435_c0_g1_i1:149-1936(+)